MPEDILTWLKGDRNYSAGLELLRRHGGRKGMLDILSTGPDHYNTPKLLAELQKVKALPVAPTAAPSPVPAAPALPKPQAYSRDHNLEKKIRIESMIKKLFQEVAHLHGKLSQIPEGDQLHQVAQSLLKKDLKKQDLFDQIHYYNQNGVWWDELPENQRLEFDPNDKEQLEQKINNIRSNRAKARKLLKKPQSQAFKEHHEKRIAEFDAELEKLKKYK